MCTKWMLIIKNHDQAKRCCAETRCVCVCVWKWSSNTLNTSTSMVDDYVQTFATNEDALRMPFLGLTDLRVCPVERAAKNDDRLD
jgi:hypothetical protein